MTREEAIKVMFYVKNHFWNDTEVNSALDMAIEALEENESLAKSVNNAAELIRKLQKKNERIPCSERLLDDVSNAYENGYRQGKFEALSNAPDTNVGKKGEET